MQCFWVCLKRTPSPLRVSLTTSSPALLPFWGRGFYYLRHPPGHQGKQLLLRIGLYGKGLAKWSLKEAREKWHRIRAWSKQTGRDPRDLKRQEQQEALPQHSGSTLLVAAESVLTHSRTRERTKQGDRNMLWK